MNRRKFLTQSAAALAAGGLSSPIVQALDRKADEMNYARRSKPNPVVESGEFVFAAAHLDHGHINRMCTALMEAEAHAFKAAELALRAQLAARRMAT